MSEMTTIRRGDVAITVHEDGAGPGFLLLPSLGRGAEDFDAVASRIAAAGFRVLRPEPRGINFSTPLRDHETLHDLAADIAAVIEAAGAAPAIVAGHAAGNWVARMLAHDRPDLVRGVAMVAALLGTGADPAIRPSIAGSFDPVLTDAERLAHLRRAYFAPGNDASVWLHGWHPAVARAQRRAADATTGTAWLRAADRVPLLYLAAARDAIAPVPTPQALRDALGPHAVLAVIEDAGHALLPEQPEATAAALIGWARGLA